MDYNKKSYAKSNLSKWILLYVVIGIVVYCLIYYFFFSNRGGYTYDIQNNDYEQTMPAVESDADLISASESLDSTDINQIDSELDQNDADASAF